MLKIFLSRFLISTLVLGLFSFVGVNQAYAAATLSLSPASGSVNEGSNITLGIYINTGGEPVNAVQANLTYSTSKLTFVSVTNSSTFEIEAETIGGSGTVKIGRGTITPKTGSHLVASVTFKGNAAGSASVSFSSSSAVVNSDNFQNILSSKVGGTYTVKSVSTTTPPPPPPPPPPPDDNNNDDGGGGSSGGDTGGTSGGSSGGTSGSGSTTTKKDTTAPKITDVKVINLTKTSATITWKTDEVADSKVSWGQDGKLILFGFSSKLVKSHSIKLSSKLLTPGAKYNYKVISKDKAGNSVGSEVLGFQIPGYKITILVLNENGDPVEGILVNIILVGEMTTNENGVVTFENVPAGKREVKIGSGGEILSEFIVVKEQDGLQTFGMLVSAAVITPSGINLTQLIGIVFVIAGLFAIIVIVLFRRKFFKTKETVTTAE